MHSSTSLSWFSQTRSSSHMNAPTIWALLPYERSNHMSAPAIWAHQPYERPAIWELQSYESSSHMSAPTIWAPSHMSAPAIWALQPYERPSIWVLQLYDGFSHMSVQTYERPAICASSHMRVQIWKRLPWVPSDSNTRLTKVFVAGVICDPHPLLLRLIERVNVN